MNNDKIMDISPISYTNKDFRAIYEELITLVNDLTARWDPTSTNESDPGLVLLKLKAFLADKLNYNIDKNTLENFPSQATQRGNAQKIYDILGYNMQYYKSATTTITMRYRPTEDKNGKFSENIKVYDIPAFTQLTDDSNTINYVTTTNVTIPTDNSNLSNIETEIIEGVAQDFLINGNNIINVDNLDSDYRLYFTESMIASNGIYVSNTSSPEDYWQGVNNLESTQLGQKVFKFGVLPTTNTCYLEFPQDAATLFGDGILIKYIITTGVEGNISANILTTLTSNLHIKDNDSEVDAKICTLIVQPSSATNGEDPESLEDAYRNCRKTIDTFNTLVTTQDYANAIYNSGVVSNVVVGDRTDDINHAYKVVNKTSDGDRIISLVDIESYKTGNNGQPTNEPDKYYLNAFNVSIYALNKSNSIIDKNSYNYTFQTSATTIYDAQTAIEEYKSIQHDYIDTIGNGVTYPQDFIFKGLAKLDGKVYTYQKVTTAEANEILKNINTALYQNFNAREVDFGVEFNYDDLIRVVEQSDDRIKTIVMDYPEYSIARMRSDNSLQYIDKLMFESYDSNTGETTTELSRTNLKSKYELDVIAKSILAGVTPYMIFDDTQILDYTMSPVKNIVGASIDNITGAIDYTGVGSGNLSFVNSEFPSNAFVAQNKGIAAITTSTQIGNNDTLLPNENIFCVGPSYVSKAQLSTCLYYTFISNKTNEDGTPYTIPAKAYYKMSDGEALFVSESITDKNITNANLITDGSKNFWAYYGSDKTQNVICPTMPIVATPTEVKISQIGLDNNKVPGSKSRNLGTANQIEILGENSVQINSNNKTIYAVWSMDNLYNQLFDPKNIETIFDSNNAIKGYRLSVLLQNNDIFIYTDEKKQSLMLLGSGTEIFVEIDATSTNDSSKTTLQNQFAYYPSIYWTMKNLDISSINTDGLNASIEWNRIPTGIRLYTAEKQITSLGEGTQVQFNGDYKITNIPREVEEFKYKYEGESTFTSLPQLLGDNVESSKWKAFSRLQLVVSPTQGQTLNSEHKQAIALYQAQTDAQSKEGTNATDAKENIIIAYGKWVLDGTNSDGSPKYKFKKENEVGGGPYAYLAGSQYITANNIIALTGGIQQNSAVMTSEGELENTLQIYISGKTGDIVSSNITYPETGSNIIEDKNITINEDAENGYTQIKLTAAIDQNGTALTNTFTLNLSPRFVNTLIPILFTSNDGSLKDTTLGNLGVKGTGATFECIGGDLTYNTNGFIINGYQNKYINYFRFKSSNPDDLTSLTLDLNVLGLKADQTITIYDPMKIKGENELLACEYDGESVRKRIKQLATRYVVNEGRVRNLFDYGHKINNEDLIEDPLNPESFFNPNHIYNKYIIPQLDTNNININISNQSLQSTRR